MKNPPRWWEDVAAVDFAQCTNNTCSGDFVHIQSGAGNNSAIGRAGGQQIINIISWQHAFHGPRIGPHAGAGARAKPPQSQQFCDHQYQQHLQSDRSSCTGGFCFDNATPPNRIDFYFNFTLIPTASTYGPYDFDSVMHDNRTAFSRNGSDTITVLPPNNTVWQNAIGQRTHLSAGDKNVMGCVYARSNWRWVSATADPSTPFGTCTQPYAWLPTGLTNTPEQGMLWIEPGTYWEISLIHQAHDVESAQRHGDHRQLRLGLRRNMMRIRLTLLMLVMVAVLLLVAQPATPQLLAQSGGDYVLLMTSATAGGTAVANDYQLDLAIGQAEAGLQSGGGYELGGGFWGGGPVTEAAPQAEVYLPMIVR